MNDEIFAQNFPPLATAYFAKSVSAAGGYFVLGTKLIYLI